MASDSDRATDQATAPGGHLPGEQAVGGHKHLHGRPVSWALVGVLVIAFITGGLAIVNQLWWLFYTCLGVAILCVPVGKIIGIMNDTVVISDPAEQEGQGGHVAEDIGSAAYPGVDVGQRPDVDVRPQRPAVGT